jgi:hypothetical protein
MKLMVSATHVHVLIADGVRQKLVLEPAVLEHIENLVPKSPLPPEVNPFGHANEH